jgi:hypothetical protein
VLVVAAVGGVVLGSHARQTDEPSSEDRARA